MIQVHAREHVIVFAGHGEWDLATAPALRAQLDVALAGAWRLIVIELQDVRFLDIAGADPIVDAVRQSRTTGQDLVLVHPQPPVARFLAFVELDQFVTAMDHLPGLTELSDALNN